MLKKHNLKINLPVLSIAGLFVVLLIGNFSVANEAEKDEVRSRIYTTEGLSKIYAEARSSDDLEEAHNAKIVMSLLYKYGNTSAGINVDLNTSEAWLNSAKKIWSPLNLQ